MEIEGKVIAKANTGKSYSKNSFTTISITLIQIIETIYNNKMSIIFKFNYDISHCFHA